MAAALMAAVALSGCAGSPASGGPDVTTAPGPVAPPPGVTVVAELGYPRDLYERGRVNLVTSRPGTEPFEVLGKRLVADHFATTALDDHRSIIPAGGQPVALQTPFGAVEDCTDDAPVQAEVELRYRFGDDASVRRSVIPLADATVLDDIRARQCTTTAVLAGSTVSFEALDVTGETMEVDVQIARSGDSPHDFRVDSAAGSVLLGASLREDAPWQDTAQRLLSVPLRLRINRCDAHAVAETTRKYGVDLWMSVDGAEAWPVPLPIGELTDEFDAMLEQCRRRTSH